MLRTVLSFIYILVLGGFVLAQETFPGESTSGYRGVGRAERMGQMRERELNQVSTILELTTEQEVAVLKAIDLRRESVQSLMKDLRSHRRDLDTLLQDSNPDPTAVGTLVISSHRIRQEIQQVQTNFLSKFRGLLDATQLEKLDLIEESEKWTRARRTLQGLRLIDSGGQDRFRERRGRN